MTDGDRPARRPLVYLDYASTAPLRPEARAAMDPFLDQCFANASGSHQLARQARRAVEEARDEVAELLGARPGEVVFTGSGTESDNLAVFGTLWARGAAGTVVCSAVEHAAVREACATAVRRSGSQGADGIRLVETAVDAEGRLDLAALEEVLDGDVALVSVMLANNEVGTIQPLAEVAALRDRWAPGAVLHTDAVQAAPWLDVATLAGPADLVTVSGHKFGGPKGVGVLVARQGTRLEPLVVGGGQEQERRSGSLNVAGIVGTAAALRATCADRDAAGRRVAALRDAFADAVLEGVQGVTESVRRDRVLPGHSHLRFEGCDQEELLVLLDDAGVCVSAGAACASGAVEPSHVLLAMGVAPADAGTGLRFTLGRGTDRAQVDHAVEAVVDAVGRLRR